MIRKLLLTAMVAGSFLMMQTTFANSCNKSHHQCKAGWKMMVKKLELSDSQQAKIKAIKAKNRQLMQANRERFKAIKLQINQLITSEKFDESVLNKLLDQKIALMRSSMKTRIMTKNEIYNILDPKQKQKFKDMMQQWNNKKRAFFNKSQD